MHSVPVIDTNELTKVYRGVEAVRKLTLAIKPHQITAFLGSNGAGKSTTIKMLLGMIKPTAGGATVLGNSIENPAGSVEVRKRVAYVSEDKRLYGYMTVKQIIRFTSSFYPDWRPEIAASLVERYALPLDRKVRSLSKGMRTKLALLLAFSRRSELLILDEPSEGLILTVLRNSLRA
jgi:ABC-2 type transport system ATP-binding protein